MLSAELVQWLRDSQRLFNDQILTDLQNISQGPSLFAYASLIMVGFFYGVLHAVGPGHGKAVVAGYVLANENSLKRGLAIVGLSSLLQAITAITLVLGCYFLLQATRTEAEHWATLLEIGSFALIGLIGLALAFKGMQDLWKIFRPRRTRHSSTYDNHQENCHGCTHDHAPAPVVLQQATSWRTLAALVVSIGIRPCSGALVLLFLACLMQLVVPGILATLAMALGTALTTGALAILAVKSRNVALKWAERSEKKLQLAYAGLRLAGGSVIMLVASVFLIAQFNPDSSPPSSASHPLYKSLH